MIETGVDPVVFTIGSVSIRWYGIFIDRAIVIPTLVRWIPPAKAEEPVQQELEVS